MAMKYAEEPFKYGYVILPKASFKMGTFPDPQNTHPGIVILESPPQGEGGGVGGVLAQWVASMTSPCWARVRLPEMSVGPPFLTLILTSIDSVISL